MRKFTLILCLMAPLLLAGRWQSSDNISQVSINLDADAWVGDATVGGPTSYGTNFLRNTLDFRTDTGDESAGIRIQIPAEYDNSSDPVIRIDWTAVATSGSVCWCIANATIVDTGVTTAITPIATDCDEITVDTTTTRQNETFITITAADFVAGQQTDLTLSRDIDGGGTGCADDDMAGDALFHSVKLVYQLSQ